MDLTQVKPQIPKFLGLLNETLLSEEKKSKDARGHEVKHYPSSASFKKADGTVSGACLRQGYYRATQTPETNPRELTSFLQAGFGNAIHDWIANTLLKNKSIKTDPESRGTILIEPLTKEISYRMDNLVTFKGEQGGLEIKTVQGFGLQYMLKEGGPKEAHLLQVLSYFGADENLRWFSIVYVARDTAFRVEFHIWKDADGKFVVENMGEEKGPKPIQELTFEGIVARWKEFEGYLERNELPARDFKAVLREGKVVYKRTKNFVDYKTDYQCLYCSHQSLCWGLPDAKDFEKKIPGVSN